MMDFEILRYPSSRVATFDVGRIGREKHHIIGLLEADISEARSRIREKIRSGSKISLMAWIIRVIGVAVAEHPQIHALNHGRGKQIVFHDVDIAVPLEREVGGKKVPLMTVIRRANTKSAEDIAREIRAAGEKRIESEDDFVLEETGKQRGGALFFNLPQVLRLLIWKLLLRDPFTRKKNMGTVIVTNIGNPGNFNGWILPKSIHNLSIGIGSINKKPWVHRGKIEVRDILHLTTLVDHDTVDGVPAGRFTSTLVKHIEEAMEL